MIKNILLAILLFTSSQVTAQFKLLNDDYLFRKDTGLNYNVYVKNNDTGTSINLVKIYRIEKQGASAANYAANLSADSTFIVLKDSISSIYTGSFRYFGINPLNSNIDSAIVSFGKVEIAPEVYPGESNKDNLVNHFDVFALGMFYGEKGDSRHNLDTNTSFTPKRISDWDKFIGSVNGKFADIDGNSLVNDIDFDKLKLNLGKSIGNYTPKLSDTNSTNTLSIQIQDTIIMPTNTTKLLLPISFKSTGTVNSYGLGYSIRVDNKNTQTNLDTFYPKYNILENSANFWNDNPKILTLYEKITKPKNSNIAFVRTNGKNGGMGSEVGIVEVVTDEILIGMSASGETIARLNIYISDICLIDNLYNTIPCKPISKTVYLKRVKASLQSNQENKFSAYPTHVNSTLLIEKSNSKPQTYFIYNSLGQIVDLGILRADKTRLDNISWNAGIYYLKLENSTEVIRLQKQ